MAPSGGKRGPKSKELFSFSFYLSLQNLSSGSKATKAKSLAEVVHQWQSVTKQGGEYYLS